MDEFYVEVVGEIEVEVEGGVGIGVGLDVV